MEPALAAAECRVPCRALGGAAPQLPERLHQGADGGRLSDSTREPMEGASERAGPECRLPGRALGGAGGAAVPARLPSRAARPVRVSSVSVSDRLALFGGRHRPKGRRCVGDGWKMGKQRAGNGKSVVAPEWLGSITTGGPDEASFRGEFYGVQGRSNIIYILYIKYDIFIYMYVYNDIYHDDNTKRGDADAP